MHIIALLTMIALLCAGIRYPGALLAGCLFTYQGSALSGLSWLSPGYGAMAVAISMVQFYRNPIRIGLSGADIGLILLLGFLAVSVMWSPMIPESAIQFVNLLMSVTAMYGVARFRGNEPYRLIRQMLLATTYAGAIFAIVMLQERVTETSSEAMRLTIDLEGASVVGLASSLPFGLFASTINTFLSKSKWRTLLSATCLAIIGYTSLVSATRGVFVAYGAGLAVALLLLVKYVKLRRFGAIGLGATFSAVGVLMFMPVKQLQHSLDRLLGNFSSNHIVVDPSAAERLYAWGTAEWLMRQHPWIGAGFGSFSYYSFAPYPHNLFMEIGSAGGIVALALLVFWLILVARDLFTDRRILGGYGVLLIGMWIIAFVHMQLSFAFFMAKPLFLMSALASAFAANPVKNMRPMKRATPNRLRTPPREALT